PHWEAFRREGKAHKLWLMHWLVEESSELERAVPDSDPRIWLEDVTGEEALAWVKARNAAALSSFGNPSDSATYSRILEILDSKAKIPYIGRVLNGLYYNFWQDETHVRGIWR
uniref:Peptidase S9A N-terminal domain-containing protein n=2 Tax=Emiliania huxleyi TaxID=2903 RepID=A0A0D3KXX7_EMIH1